MFIIVDLFFWSRSAISVKLKLIKIKNNKVEKSSVLIKRFMILIK